MRFHERRYITPRWQGFMKQSQELKGHKSPLLGIHTRSSSQTLRLSDCCLPGWLFARHIDLHFVAHSSVYYQPSQTGLNLLFPLTHANREPLLSICLPRLPQMTCECGWLLAGRPACLWQRGQAAVGRFGLTVCLGDLKVLETVAKDYSSMPWHADVRFGNFVMQHRCKAGQTNK